MRPGLHTALLVFISILLLSACGSRGAATGADASGQQRNSDNFAELFIDACTHFNNANYQVAIKMLNRCITLKPDEAAAHYELSRAYIKTGDKALSLQHALKANSLDPLNTWYAIWCAGQLKISGNTTEAIRILEKSSNAHPADEQTTTELDALYARSADNTDKRIELWQRYRKAAGYKLNTAIKLAELYKLKKDYASAHRVYDEIKTLSPRKIQFFIADANLYLEQNDEAAALLIFEKTRQTQPLNFQLNYAIFRLYASKGNGSEASNALKLAFSDPQTDADTKLKACAELKQKSLTDTSYLRFASAAVEALLILYPENDKFIFTSAAFLEASGNYRSALQAYRKVCRINPNMFESWLNAIRICDITADYNQKAEIAEQALEYFPNIAALYTAAASANNALKQYDKALEFCNNGSSFALDTSKYGILLQKGVALFGLGRFEAAETEWLSALAIKTGTGQLYEYLGDVSYKLDKQDKALEYWQKALETGPENDKLRQKIRNGKYVE